MEGLTTSAYGYKQTFRRSVNYVRFAPESGHCYAHSADGWREVLEPVVERYGDAGQYVP